MDAILLNIFLIVVIIYFFLNLLIAIKVARYAILISGTTFGPGLKLFKEFLFLLLFGIIALIIFATNKNIQKNSKV